MAPPVASHITDVFEMYGGAMCNRRPAVESGVVLPNTTDVPSFWLADLPSFTVGRSVQGDQEFDVAIVGAGFSGLWTAWYLLEADPTLRIAIVEAEFAGFGASGRNGGWCTEDIALSLTELSDRYGEDGARSVVDTMRASVDAIGEVARSIECDYRKTGMFLVARGIAQVPGLKHSYDALVHLDRADGVELLDGAAARANVHASRVEAGMYNPHGAALQPAKLARGLADVLEQRGVVIYEKSPVTDITALSGKLNPLVRTDKGSVAAPVVSVSAEAWIARLQRFRRRVLPVYSLIVLTEPLTSAQWDAVGWEQGECLASYQLSVDYLTKTADGRILFGGRGAPYHFGSRIEPQFDMHPPTHDALRKTVVEWWPALEGIRFTHAWGGPLAIPRDFTPNIGYDPASGIAGAFGYVGQGVATTHMAGQYLAADITDTSETLRPLPFMQHRSRRWEPEPLRWLGARFVQRSFARIDRRSERTGVGPSGSTLAERLFNH